jgi:hypothetical protein
MNLRLIQRVFLRSAYVHDRRVYEAFLQHIDAHGDVWKVSQREIAEWWERRQNARLSIDFLGNATFRVSCPLNGVVVEIDGDELRVPPFELSFSVDVPARSVGISCGCKREHAGFLFEVLGHLGYGHVTLAVDGDRADVPEDEMTPVLEALIRACNDQQRYDPEVISKLRGILRRVHRRLGLPDLRIWNLPHRDGRPYRVCVSTRYDVDRAIVNLPVINELEAKHGLSSTVYLRPRGYFYGRSEIERYARLAGMTEIALHGEFITTAESLSTDEYAAAILEKKMLEEIVRGEVVGVCMHGGELRTNTTPRTKDSIERAGFRYETMYRNDYYLPLHLPHGNGVRKTLSIGQHYADVSATPGPGFEERLLRSFIDHFSRAESAGGVFIPVLHPLYFGLFNYMKHPRNAFRVGAFIPRLFMTVARMKRDQFYGNKI